MNQPLSASRPDREPLPRDFWYVACASAELNETPLPRAFHGWPLVLFRGADGAPVALHDRCPHRGVALSLGQVSEGAIACAYHGWRFGADGACVHVPSLVQSREIAAGVAVRRFPCVELDGYVWAWAGDGAPTPDGPPAIADFVNRVWIQGALDLACEAILPIENNLDLAHPYFTHPNTHPQWFAVQQFGFRDMVCDLGQTSTGLEVILGRSGVRLVFDLPDRVTVAAGPLVVLHHTPTTPGHCRQHWLFSPQAASAEAPHSLTWSDETPVIFEQDRRVMESAQKAYDTEGDDFERSVEADAPTLMARRLLRLAGRNAWPPSEVPCRRPVHFRS